MRGTWNFVTGEKVKRREAIDLWADAATIALLRVASRFNDMITYSQLRDEIWATTGIKTGSRLDFWIGGVLERVAQDCLQRGEVQLTSLCVHQDGTVGEGFKTPGDFVSGDTPVNADDYAAEQRLLCYRKYASDLPPDGGQPNLPQQVAARRKAAAPQPPPAMCPIHHTTLPKSGQCDEC